MNNKTKIALICICMALFIVFWGYIRCKFTINDPLLYQFKISGWEMSHFIFFLILTLLYPSEYRLIFTLSVCWEVFECILSVIPPNYLKSAGNYCPRDDQMYNGQTSWWCGNPMDLIMNSGGILLGLLILKKI